MSSTVTSSFDKPMKGGKYDFSVKRGCMARRKSKMLND